MTDNTSNSTLTEGMLEKFYYKEKRKQEKRQQFLERRKARRREKRIQREQERKKIEAKQRDEENTKWLEQFELSVAANLRAIDLSPTTPPMTTTPMTMNTSGDIEVQKIGDTTVHVDKEDVEMEVEEETWRKQLESTVVANRAFDLPPIKNQITTTPITTNTKIVDTTFRIDVDNTLYTPTDTTTDTAADKATDTPTDNEMPNTETDVEMEVDEEMNAIEGEADVVVADDSFDAGVVEAGDDSDEEYLYI